MLSKEISYTVHLSARAYYLFTLAARIAGRTTGEAIVASAIRGLSETPMPRRAGEPAPMSMSDAATLLWDADIDKRILRLHEHYPELLTEDERRIVAWYASGK